MSIYIFDAYGTLFDVHAAIGRFRELPSLGFSDCLILETARKAGHLPLGTFDHDLGSLEGAHTLS